MSIRRTFALLSVLAIIGGASAQITVTVIHTNDLHAHVEPTRIQGKNYGGYARKATLIQRLRRESPNAILLNAGDTFQGTLYFNVYEGLADLAIMNAIGYQAMTVGNHEFDRGPAPLARFAAAAAFPLLAANLDLSGEPSLKDRIVPSTILETGGTKVAVIGAITEDTPAIASPGPTVKFLPVAASVQREVDRLTAQGIDKIVVMTHIGYSDDLELAKKLRNVDLIVGGHSHTPLGTPALPGWRASAGAYPTVVNDAAGKPVYVVQGWEWGKVVGRIELKFDAKGQVTGLGKADALVVDESIAEDPIIRSMVEAFRKPIAAMQDEKVGVAAENLPREIQDNGARPMAWAIADAMLEAVRQAGAVAAFINSGGVRASIEAGDVTYGEAIAVQPFSNTLVLLDLSGAELLGALEHGAGAGGMLLPSAGTSYRIDGRAPEGKRVSEVMVGGQPLDLAKSYRIAIPNFIANGGDGHEGIKNAKGRRLDTGLLDIDALIEYLKKNSPVKADRTVRIRRA